MAGIPFKDFDFWAYLSAGFLFLFTLDYILKTSVFTKESWTVVQVVVAASAAYVVGNLASSISSTLFERMLVGRFLGPPRQILFGAVTGPKVLRVLMPEYFEALPPNTRNKALEKGRTLGVTGPGEELFWPAYDAAKNNAVAMVRLQSFMHQYVFCRNVALVAFVDAAMLAGSHLGFTAPKDNLWWAAGAIVAGIGMLFRYLKYYRLYAVEVFTSFAYSK
jgi:ethanolamine transporter EutH